METFSALLALYAGNSPVTGEFPAKKGLWSGALMFSLCMVFYKVKLADNNTASFTKYNCIELAFVSNPDVRLHTIRASFQNVLQAFTVGYRKLLWVFMLVIYLVLKGELS